LISKDCICRLLLVLLFSTLISSQYETATVRASPAGEIIWTQTNNPSEGSDRAYGVAVDASDIYVVGYDESPGNTEWRIEKRSLATGSLIWSQASNPSTGNDGANSVALDGSGIYIVGYDSSPGNVQWRIEKRNLTDGSLIWSQVNNPSAGSDEAYSVAVDSSGIYVVGYDRSPGIDDNEWRIEKRSLTDGSLIWSQVNNPSTADDRARGVTIDASGIYVVGDDESPAEHDWEWRIEKRSLTDGLILWTQTANPSAGDDGIRGVAVDASGIYAVGYDHSPGNYEWRVEKRSLTDGSLIWSQVSNPSGEADIAHSVAVDASGIYMVGRDDSPGNPEWRIEKRHLTDGSIIWNQADDPSVGNEDPYGVAVDASGVYIVGYDQSPGMGNFEWRIEKRDPSRPASKLVITVYPSSAIAASWTTKYTIQRQDQYSNPVTSGSTVVNLASTSTGTSKKFAETSGGAAVITVTIPDGSSVKDFHYYDDKAGSWEIAVSTAGLTGDSKLLTVNPRLGCVIATATYGSELAPEVAYMRHVRDGMIGSNKVGQQLVNGWNVFYYLWSPPLAQFVDTHDVVKPIFKVLLLPLVGTIHLTAFTYTATAPLNTGFSSVIAFLFASISAIAVYIVFPLLVLRALCRRTVVSVKGKLAV